MKEAEEEGQEAKKDEVKRKKIQFFKFWPKHLLQSAWKTYAAAGEEGAEGETPAEGAETPAAE